MRWIASSHFASGRWESSKIVPTLTVNCSRQAPHFHRPGREVLPCNRYERSTVPQWGHVGSPAGHTMLSTHAIASSSEAHTLAMSDRFMAQSPLGLYLGVERGVVKYIIAGYSRIVNPGDDSKFASRRTMLEAGPAGQTLWKHKGNNIL